jgi:polysaccharide chain length determinant protein (PEP-CTERM system associated)
MDATSVPSSLGDYIGVLRRRKVYLLTIFPAVLLLAAFLAFALPSKYRSTATILLEPASVSETLARTLSSYADEQFELVQRQVLTPTNLEPIISEIDPYPDSPELSPSEKARLIIDNTFIERVDPVTLEVLQESAAFSIHYHNADPNRAASVAQQLSDLFLQFNRKSRSERATAAYEFLLTQSQDVEKRISDVDMQVSQFKSRHGEALPEAQLRNFGAAERSTQNLFTIDSQIRAATERKGLLEVQLSKLNPTLGSTTGNTQSELATLQGQLADARVRYTPDHPDVKRLQRQIEALNAKAAADPSGGKVVPNNPDYLAVQSQIEAARREIAALQQSAAQEQRQIYSYQAGATAAPTVEREYEALMRARGALVMQFDDLQEKLREADISRNLEAEQKGDRFSQIRSPKVESIPYSPNRLGIILLGFVLGAGLSVGLAALAESSDPSVRGVRDLREITQISTIATIPVILNEADARNRRMWWVRYAGSMAVAILIVLFTIMAA